MKVHTSNPGGDQRPGDKADQCTHCAQSRGLGRKEAADEPFGCAQSFHDGEVTTPVQHPSGKSCEHTKGGGKYDQCRRRQQGCAGLAQDTALGFDDLTNRLHGRVRQSLR